jgi:hypothetical protein
MAILLPMLPVYKHVPPCPSQHPHLGIGECNALKLRVRKESETRGDDPGVARSSDDRPAVSFQKGGSSKPIAGIMESKEDPKPRS